MEFLLTIVVLLFVALLIRAIMDTHPAPLDITPEQILRDADAMCHYGHHRQAAELLEVYCQRFPDNALLRAKLAGIHQRLSRPASAVPASRLVSK